jgi:hypothetical protein
MGPIRVNCPRCWQPLAFGWDQVGERLACPGCGRRVRVPGDEGERGAPLGGRVRPMTWVLAWLALSLLVACGGGCYLFEQRSICRLPARPDRAVPTQDAGDRPSPPTDPMGPE